MKLRVESWDYKLRVRYFPLQYNKNTKDFRFQTNLLLEFSMHSEPSPQHQMSGNLPPRNREESREKYHEVVQYTPPQGRTVDQAIFSTLPYVLNDQNIFP